MVVATSHMLAEVLNLAPSHNSHVNCLDELCTNQQAAEWVFCQGRSPSVWLSTAHQSGRTTCHA